MNIYHHLPTLQTPSYFIRPVADQDLNDLLEVYSDKNALPFFNSDNCDGDIFYYNTKKKMQDAMDFWKYSYDNGWFARLSIEEKATKKVIGTIELCLRISDDAFHNAGILRLDVGSAYEQEQPLYELLSAIVPSAYELLSCNQIITKAPEYAVERIAALEKCGFAKSEHCLIEKENGYPYNGYWLIQNNS